MIKLNHPEIIFQQSFAILLVILGICAAYSPGIYGGFYFDDFPNLIQNVKLAISEPSISELWRAAHSSEAGPFKRPIAMSTFALNHFFSQYNPLPYKVTNIAIHLVNTLLVYIFFLSLTRAAVSSERNCRIPASYQWKVSLFAAACWGLHPIGITSVLYIVQRMNSLATLFLLLTFISFLYARVRLHLGLRFFAFMLASVSLFGLLAVLSKESALLLPLFLLLIEFSFFSTSEQTPRYWKIFRVSALLIVIASGLIWLGYHLLITDWAKQAYAYRFFDIKERAFTETRILWQYWQFILLPNIQHMGLHLDDFPLSKSLFNPLSTTLAIAGHGALLLLAFLARNKYRVLSFAIFWFYIGHLLESTIFPLELMYEHRNYLPMMGPLYAVGYYGGIGIANASIKLKPILAIAALILLLLIGTATSIRASQWGNQWEMPFIEATHHPYSTRANFFAGRACGELMVNSKQQENKSYFFDCAVTYLNRSSTVSKSVPEPLIALAQLHVAAAKPVPAEVIKELKYRLSSKPLGNDGAYLAKGLLDLGMADEKIIPNSTVEDLFVSAIKNQKLTGVNKAHILAAYGMLQCEELHACENGIQVLKQAVEVSPTTQFMIVLGTYYLRSNQPENALQIIRQARMADSHQMHAEDLDNLEKHAMLYLQH